MSAMTLLQGAKDWFLYYVKFVIMLLLMTLRARLSSRSTTGFGGDRKVTQDELKEQVRSPEDQCGIDAAYFNGCDFAGNFFGLGIQKRPQGHCESVFFVRLAELASEPLVLPANPSAWTRHIDNEWTTTDGLRFSMRSAMKRWKVQFEGDVVELRSRKPHKLSLVLEWRGFPGIFDSDRGVDLVAMARALASSSWSREFWANLRELHQSHYELFGETVACEAILDDGEQVLTTSPRFCSMKDRSYGKHRNWGDFRRYVLHYLHTDDGLMIGCHLISINRTFRELVVGFIMDRSGLVSSIRSCEPGLAGLRETEIPSSCGARSIVLDLVAGNGQRFNVAYKVLDVVKFHCGENRDATLFSCHVQGDINGRPMVGMCEFEYNSAQYTHILD